MAVRIDTTFNVQDQLLSVPLTRNIFTFGNELGDVMHEVWHKSVGCARNATAKINVHEKHQPTCDMVASLNKKISYRHKQVLLLAGSVPIANQGFACFQLSGMLHDDGSASCLQTLNTIKTSIIHCDYGVDDRIQGDNETINSCRVQGSFKLLILPQKAFAFLVKLVI
jgi:hypothetical protein